MVLNKTAVKRLFNDAGVQVNILALNNIDNWALSLVNDMVQRAKKQGIKRLISRKISDVLPTIVDDEDD
jgi:ABC-type transporter Mla MlaB component